MTWISLVPNQRFGLVGFGFLLWPKTEKTTSEIYDLDLVGGQKRFGPVRFGLRWRPKTTASGMYDLHLVGGQNDSNL